MQAGFWTRFLAWAKQPFTTQMSATNWALFLAFAITVSVAWYHVLRHITASIAEEI
jgi:hypothetical protein